MSVPKLPNNLRFNRLIQIAPGKLIANWDAFVGTGDTLQSNYALSNGIFFTGYLYDLKPSDIQGTFLFGATKRIRVSYFQPRSSIANAAAYRLTRPHYLISDSSLETIIIPPGMGIISPIAVGTPVVDEFFESGDISKEISIADGSGLTVAIAADSVSPGGFPLLNMNISLYNF